MRFSRINAHISSNNYHSRIPPTIFSLYSFLNIDNVKLDRETRRPFRETANKKSFQFLTVGDPNLEVHFSHVQNVSGIFRQALM